jgi:MFS family permease
MPENNFRIAGIYYGWVVVAGMFVTLFLVLGTRFAFGVFYVAILEDTGWSRADTAAIFSISMAVYSVTVILSGALFDRFGPRRVFPLASILLGLGIYLCSTIQNIWTFYFYYGVIVGISYSLLGFPTHMAVIPRWFDKNRGLASALALSGMGVGSLIITLASNSLIAEYGWRTTYVIFSVVLVAVLVPLNYLVHRDSPQETRSKTTEQSESGSASRQSSHEGFTVLQSMRMPVWWLLLLAVTMLGYVSMTMAVHQTQLSLDLGYTMGTASLLFGMIGVTRSAGQITWGALSDYFGRNLIFLTVTLLGIAGVGFLFLAMGSPQWIYLAAFTLLFGFGFLGLSPIYASSVADIFQGRHLGKILGTLDIGFGIGAFAGPWLAGFLFDMYGHYIHTLIMFVVAMIIAAGAMYIVNRAHQSRP